MTKIESIILETEQLVGIKKGSILSGRRTKTIIYAKRIAIHRARECGFSYWELAEAFGMADHTSIVHYFKRGKLL